MITKVCTDCQDRKPIEDFPVDRSAASGRKSYCKVCNNLRSKRHKEGVSQLEKNIPTKKTCSRCGLTKPSSMFARSSASMDGLFSQCKSCQHDGYEAYKTRPKQAFHGKVCPGCGEYKEATAFGRSVRTKDGLQYWCSDCRANHHSEHRDEHLEYLRNYGAANRDKRVQYNKRYYRENQDALLQRQKEYFQTRYKGTEAYRTNTRMKNGRRRSRSAAAINDWSAEKEKFLYDAQRGKCARCGYKMTWGGRRLKTNMTVDHIVPLSLGGGLTLRNAQLLCQSCNSSKNATIEDYRTWVPTSARVYSVEDLTRSSTFWDSLNIYIYIEQFPK